MLDPFFIENPMTGIDNVIQVLLPLPHTVPFDYLVPVTLPVIPGNVVIVPFRGRNLVGIVWGSAPSTLAKAKLKAVISCLALPPLSPVMLAFIRWVGDYTLFPYGSVLRMVMPISFTTPFEAKKHYSYTLGTVGNIRMTPERERVISLLRVQPPKTLQAIVQEAGVSISVIQSLKRLAVLKEVEVVAAPLVAVVPSISLASLSQTQQQAAANLHQKLGAGYSVTVIDGVTGSGKTEVYFSAIAAILQKEEGQVLILLPEIALTAQFLARFRERFGFTPVEWHSDLGDKARKEVWHGILSGTIRLVVGARSALFLPFNQLALIVVDEEHEGAYKQEEGVLYHARDMAVVRAYLAKIPIILASATPSLETVINIQAGKFTRLHLPARYGEATLPAINVVDMRSSVRQKQCWISAPLKEALIATLKEGQQSMLFLNRRGYAPLTLCQSCGYRMTCPNCSSWMVEHRAPRRLECHHCGHHCNVPHLCPGCSQEESLVACGPGVERVAEEVKSFLPQARIIVMTKDTVKTIASAQAIINAILNREVDIIIGTQMVAKGHHFPALTLVGIVDADLGLSGGDLRAAERTYQLLHQVSGRAGREHKRGAVILQSYMPDNPIIQALVASERDNFIENEIQSRRESLMPPFSRLAALIISGENEQLVVQTAKNLARMAPLLEGAEIFGPAPAILYQLRRKFRYRLLMKTARNINIQKLLGYWLERVALPPSIQVKVDIDPYSFF